MPSYLFPDIVLLVILGEEEAQWMPLPLFPDIVLLVMEGEEEEEQRMPSPHTYSLI